MSEAAGIDDGQAAAAAEATATAAAAEATALEAVATGAQGGEPSPDASPDSWLPEKHVVKKEDGTVDIEASARKQADAYRALEKRLGAGDIPPKTAEEYAPELTIEGFDVDELKNDELYKDFAAKAHAEGFTNKQFSLAVNEFLPRAAELMKAEAQQTSADCTAQLKEMWPTDNEFKVNTSNALRVVNAYAASHEEASEIIKAIGNNAKAIKLLAAIGPELEEGKSPGAVQSGGMIDIEALQKSEAYWREDHPDHTATKARVAKYYAEKYPQQK